MASLSTCHLGLWLGWQILLNLVKSCLTSPDKDDVVHVLFDDIVATSRFFLMICQTTVGIIVVLNLKFSNL